MVLGSNNDDLKVITYESDRIIHIVKWQYNLSLGTLNIFGICILFVWFGLEVSTDFIKKIVFAFNDEHFWFWIIVGTVVGTVWCVKMGMNSIVRFDEKIINDVFAIETVFFRY